MQSHITTAIIIALALAFIAAAATCQATKRTGELRAEEAREEAARWERTARANAEALERAEDARRRAAQSTQDYLNAAQEADGRRDDARQIVDEMRKDSGDCGWLDMRVPGGVRDAIRELYPGSGCD
jgi:hypothetical protein